MIVTAIIAEYNPFHLGHKYHIEQARSLTKADVIIVIMSGNFVQRGEPAIFDKHLRSNVALDCGADMVIELPYPYSCASAEYFAQSAVTILDKLSCVDYLCFGSECDNIPDLYTIAKELVCESDDFKYTLKEMIKSGVSYPKARHDALMSILKDEKYEPILTSPNNILGIEYIKSLIILNSNIKPFTIKRIVSDYHHSDDNNPYFSASTIRNAYTNGNLNMKDLTAISKLYETKMLCPVELKDFSQIIAHKLLEHKYNLEKIFDISPDLADRITNNIDKYTDADNFITLLKTKNINYTTISRTLCHIMFNITKNDMFDYKTSGYSDYARVLAFNDNALPLFKLVEEHNKLKLVTKLSKANEILEDIPSYNKNIFEKNMFVDDIYRLIAQNKYNTTLPNEYQHKLR